MMMVTARVAASLVLLVCCLLTASAQVKPALQGVGPSEVFVGFTGDFPKRTCNDSGVIDPCRNDIRVDSSNSGGLLMNYRHQFTNWSAIELNYDYTRFSKYYNTGAVIRTRVDEATLAYVLNFHNLARQYCVPFVEAGIGALIFTPQSSTLSGTIPQDRSPIIYGVGVNLSEGGHLAVRVGYRGLIFQEPDFGLPGQTASGITHIAEPYVGIAVRF